MRKITTKGALPEQLHSSEDICKWLRIGRRTLQTWRQTGQFPNPDIAIGKTVRWSPRTVEAWYQQRQKSRISPWSSLEA